MGRVPESGKFLVLGKFCLWNPAPWALESGIILRNPKPTNDWNPESKFYWKRIQTPLPGIRNPRGGVQNPELLTFLYVGQSHWPEFYILLFTAGDGNSDFRRKGERWQSLKGSCAGDPTAQRQAKKNLIRGIEATFGGSMGLLEKDVNIMCGKTGDKRSVAGRWLNS